MAGSVGYFEDIYSGEDQYYWLTRPQYIMWRNICYGKDTADADDEIEWLIKEDELIEITEQNKQNEPLYFIDVTRVESFQAHSDMLSNFEAYLSYFGLDPCWVKADK